MITMIAAMAMTACGNKENKFYAMGTFEATEVTVSAEQNGRLMEFSATEGEPLNAGQQVALTDTVQLWLKACRIGAGKEVLASERPDIEKQIAATRQQLATATRERARWASLVSEGAANRKQLDDAESAVKVLQRQLAAQQSALGNTSRSLSRQMSATDIERRQIIDMLNKCHVKAPISGMVLETYAEKGEYATVGRPLFKMADTKNMHLRAYVTTAQLERVKPGQRVAVTADYGNGNGKQYEGRVEWIAQKAEFTPKTILTDDERADQVYAVKIAVKNDGGIKIGMYGKVSLDI